MSRSDGEDVKGEHGGDTGNTKQQEKGETAEKGDARRPYRQHEGQTRERTDHGERSGSDSNAGKHGS
jgi:hypothetical protein